MNTNSDDNYTIGWRYAFMRPSLWSLAILLAIVVLLHLVGVSDFWAVIVLITGTVLIAAYTGIRAIKDAGPD